MKILQGLMKHDAQQERNCSLVEDFTSLIPASAHEDVLVNEDLLVPVSLCPDPVSCCGVPVGRTQGCGVRHALASSWKVQPETQNKDLVQLKLSSRLHSGHLHGLYIWSSGYPNE